MSRLGAFLFTVVWSFCALAAAPTIEVARKQVDDLDYATALKTLDQLDRADGNSAEVMKELWLLQGVSYGTLGKDAKTRDAFRKLLIVFPDAKLLPDLPPRVRTPFFEAKEWAVSSGLLTATPEAVLAGGALEGLKITVGPDVLRLAKTARFHLKGSDGVERQEDVALSAGTATLTASGRVEWWAELLTERKGALVRTALRTDGAEAAAPVVTAAPSAPAEAPPPSVKEAQASGGWGRGLGIAMLVAGAASAGVGLGFGAASLDSRNRVVNAPRDSNGLVSTLTQKQAAALEASANTQAAVANVLFGVGGGLAAIGVVLVIVGPGGQPVAQLSPTAGGVVLTGAF